LIVLTRGGGGFGRPTTRDRAAVKADLDAELISLAAAQEIYGLASAPA
jgi:N-methylhydantoinase B